MSITFKEPDKILADILTVFMGLDATRVVLAVENYEPPKDQGIYITIQTEEPEIMGVSQVFDPATGSNESSLSAFQRLTVNITSRDRTALQRKEEVVMALTSIYSQQQQELQQVRIFREGQIMNLSFIEASKALHRYQIPVKIVYVKSKVITGTSSTQVPVIVPTNNPVLLEEA